MVIYERCVNYNISNVFQWDIFGTRTYFIFSEKTSVLPYDNVKWKLKNRIKKKSESSLLFETFKKLVNGGDVTFLLCNKPLKKYFPLPIWRDKREYILPVL